MFVIVVNKFNQHNMFKEKSSAQGLLAVLGPKTVFILGIITGILVLCTVGFFVLLAGNFKGGSAPKNVVQLNQNVNSQPAQPGVANLQKITKDDHLRGELKAPVMLIEFSDYQCPFCQQIHPTLKKIFEDYNGQVAWAYKHFPLDQLHPFARQAAEAAECAGDQDKFWEYSDSLYNNQKLFSETYFAQLASELGLNAGKFNDCVASGKYKDLVSADQAEGISAGVSGTPGTFVNGQLVKGAVPYETFKQIIDSILAK